MRVTACQTQELLNLSPAEQIKNLKQLTAINLLRIMNHPDFYHAEIKKAFGREINELVLKGAQSITHVFNMCGENTQRYTCYMPYSGLPDDITFIGQNGTSLVVIHVRIPMEDPDEWLGACTNAHKQQEELAKRAADLYATWRIYLKGNEAYKWSIPIIPTSAHFISLVPGDTWERAKHVSVRMPDMEKLLPKEVLVGKEPTQV